MRKSVFAKKATQRALAGFTSLALVAGGLTAMPVAAGAQEIKECNASFVGPQDRGLENSNFRLDRKTYRPGDILHVSADNFYSMTDPFLTLNGDVNTGVFWPDQERGDDVDVFGRVLRIDETDDFGNVEGSRFQVRAVLPSWIGQGGLSKGKNILTLWAVDENSGAWLSRSVEFWVNETGREGDSCSYTFQQEGTPATPNPGNNPIPNPFNPAQPGGSSSNKLIDELRDDPEDVLLAIAAAIGIPALIAGVVGILMQQGLIPQGWFKF